MKLASVILMTLLSASVFAAESDGHDSGAGAGQVAAAHGVGDMKCNMGDMDKSGSEHGAADMDCKMGGEMAKTDSKQDAAGASHDASGAEMKCMMGADVMAKGAMQQGSAGNPEGGHGASGHSGAGHGN